MYTSLLVLFGCLVSCTLGQYYFVTVPNVIRYNFDENITVNVFGLKDVSVKVWLQNGDKKFSEKEVKVQNEDNPSSTATIKVTEADLFVKPDMGEKKPSTIQVCSQYLEHKTCQDVLMSYRTGYLIVQTDKPIYTPRQKINIRVAVIDESLKAWKEKLVMEIISPSNMTFAVPIASEADKNVLGFYSFRYELPPHPELGLWTVRTYMQGQYDTSERAVFQVDEYVVPTFGVTIDVDIPYILIERTKHVDISVKASYVYGKQVSGKAWLDLYLNDGGQRTHILRTNRKQMQTTADSYSVAEFEIDVDVMMGSDALGNVFPVGKRLEVIATVFEDETGVEEQATHGNTVFTDNPYRFSFSESKLHFRPGMEYFLKTHVYYANGAPVQNKQVSIKVFHGNVFEKKVDVLTDDNGNIFKSFATRLEANSMKFKVSTEAEQWESDDFVVKPYQGENQIQVELITKDGHKLMRALTNLKGDTYTGMLFMVVSRGHVLYTKYKPPGNERSEGLTEDLERLVSPNGRLIVFYVDKSSGEIVADSARFNVEHKCRGKDLYLQSGKPVLKPGGLTPLSIYGDPFMNVGLNVMDKAVLLLNNKNVLRRSKMFDIIGSHDLGCGVGSGLNSAEVFKNTGLVVLTNAVIQTDIMKRGSIECDERLRQRRQASNECYGADIACCDEGIEYADNILYLAENVSKIDAFTKCFTKAKAVIVNGTVTMKCANAVFESCKLHIEDAQGESTVEGGGRSLASETDYKLDLERILALGMNIKTRKDFQESWNFIIKTLDREGKMKLQMSYPDSITEWMIQAIGISSEGICIAHPINVTTFRDFFIQLNLPYKAVRLEQLEAKATIFNYKPINVTANVYLKGISGLCYDGESGLPSRRIKTVLPSNSAKTLRFPMVSMKPGKFPVTVTAMVFDNGIDTDEVRKDLFVENEGIEERIPIEACLDPLQQADDCISGDRVHQKGIQKGDVVTQTFVVDLSLPPDSIPGTGSASAYLLGSLMDNVVKTVIEKGVESLLQRPNHCGEQTMIFLAPTVYAMEYLKQTKQVTDEIEKKGNEYIRYGVTREITNFRHDDGSYSAWRHRTTSTWLTAFVAKVFCQAKKVIDDSVDEEDIIPTIKWLIDNIEPDGYYIDKEPVIHREMIGQVKDRNKDPSLTAFVLIALQECSGTIKAPPHNLKETIKTVMATIENLDANMLRNNPYLLAISTYALSLSKSLKKYEFKDILDGIKIKAKDGTHWGNAGGFPASANSVETTAYALLAYLQFRDYKTSSNVVAWLTAQRNAEGSFRTTQDTVVGLQALSSYSVKTYSANLHLKVSLIGDNNFYYEMSITKNNTSHETVIERLPVESGDNKLTVTVSGTGSARMLIDLRYNRPAGKNELCGFKMSDIAVSEVNVINPAIKDLRQGDICGNYNEGPPEYYDDLAFGEAVIEAQPRIADGKIGRKKRAGRGKRVSSEMKCVRFSVSAAYNNSGMSMVIFGLETGVEAIKGDLDELVKRTENIDAYEYEGKGFVAFYLREVTKTDTNFIFRLNDKFNDESGSNARQPASVTVYDYYKPERTCSKMYRTNGEAFSFECNQNERPQCQCLRNICSKPVEEKLMTLARKNLKPVVELLKYTCNVEKANYAVLVKIETVDINPDNKQQIEAQATVIKRIHKGMENLRDGSEMRFFYPMHCDLSLLEAGKKYYIIAKDGFKVAAEGGSAEYKYPLMGTALVIKRPPGRNDMIYRIMRAYQQLMAVRGCAV